ncbi:MAG: hypothetical protein KDC38_16670 [Planctomycetes bacterium]|nr:hypothetical protein [Planctomycetota bacterium]
MADFVEFAANAHSWYKHLPPVETAPFCFYLDPSAGMELWRNAEGEVEARPRDPANRFHYTWMPTDVYRRRFSALEFDTDRGSRFIIGRQEGAIFVGPTGRPLPAEIMDAGEVGWNAVVHRRAATTWWWRWQLGDSFGPWPDESGGDRVIEEIAELIRATPKTRECDEALDPEIRRLVLPEQRRQKRLAEEAIARVVALVYGAEPDS